LLFIWLLLWKKRVRRKIGDPELVKGLTAAYSRRKFFVKFILVLLASLPAW
jgi:Ca-activated chloride channel family protein